MATRKKSRKSAPRRARRAAAPARRSTRRRSGGGGSLTKRIMNGIMPVALGAAGYVAAGYVGNKLLNKQQPGAKAAILAGGGLVLSAMLPGMAPLGVGMAINGAVQLAGQMLPQLTAPAAINGPTQEDIALLESLAVNGIESLNGYGDMINGNEALNGIDGDELNLDGGMSRA